MFVKVDDNTYVNLLNVSEVRDNGSELKVFFNDGEESTIVKEKQSFLHRMSIYNQAFQRLANGRF